MDNLLKALDETVLRTALNGPLKALTEFKQFIVYKLAPDDKRLGKNGKYPVNYRNPLGNYINCHNHKYWADYDTAIKAAVTAGPAYGVGFVFTDSDPLLCVDIDNCLEPCGTKWSSIAIEITKALPGAAIEISSSGKGLHIFCQGTTPLHACKNSLLNIELYTERRFIALTGNMALGDAGLDLSRLIPQFVEKYFTITSDDLAQNNTPEIQWEAQALLGAHPDWNGPTDDGELLDLMLKSKSAANKLAGDNAQYKASFSDLFNNTPALSIFYNDDRSRMDAALAQHLAFWTGNDVIRIERFMRDSKLREDDRSKWDDRSDYLRGLTILNACRKQKTFYNDKRKPYKQNTPCEFSRIIQKKDYPQLNTSLKPLDTYHNLQYLLDKKGITVQWNDMTRAREVIIPNFPIFSDDHENSALREITNIATINNMPIKKIDDHLNSLAQLNHYHPIIQCIDSKVWDGIPRLNTHIKSLKTTNDELSHKLAKKWMISAVEAIYTENEFISPGVLVLQGSQGKGKTFWVMSLDPCNSNAVKSGALLDPTNKDCLITHASHWIVELGELDGTFKKDIARIKSHITNSMDEVRTPYARKNSRYARRHVYIATVNVGRFLIDDTGNRRWWTIEIIDIDLTYLRNLKNNTEWMQQVWAEVYHCWVNGEKAELTSDEFKQLNISNIEHEQIDPFEEKTLNHYDWREGWRNYSTTNLTATDVLTAIGYNTPTISETTRMGRILIKLTGVKSHRRRHTIPQKKQHI